MQGKELAVVMAGADERHLIDWLRGTTTIQILALNARHESSVWLDDLPPASGNGLNTRFALWNRAFDWTPEVQVRDHDAGVCNARTAPVIEYRRAGGSAGIEGRLYWPRGMCADGPFEHAHRRYAYDVVAFERWWRQTDRSMGEITCTSAAARGCTAAVCVPRCRTKDREPACLRGQLVSGQLMESATIDGKNREALDGRCALQCGHEHPQHLSKNCCTGR